MITPPFLLSEPIGALWLCAKVTLVLSVAWATARMLRGASAAARHLIWALGLAGAFALVVLTPVVPRIRFAVVTGKGAVTIRAMPTVTGAHPVAASPGVSPAGLRAPLGWLSTVWLAGAAVLALRLAVAWLRLGRLERGGRAPPADWRSPAPARTRILLSDRIGVPVTWGSLRPVILLPASSVAWPVGRVRAVVAHESAHVRRFDHLVQSLGRVACVIFWFHPLAWLALRRLRALSERAADDGAVLTGIPSREYAAHLVAIARTAWGYPVATGALGLTRRTDFEQRILAILGDVRPRLGPGRTARIGFALVALGAVFALASVRIHLGG